MKTLANALVLATLVSSAAFAAETRKAPNPHDMAAMIKLSQIEAHKSMLGMCGVTGDDAEKYLAKDTAQVASLEAALSDDGKSKLADTRQKIDDGVKASWDKETEETRAKSCEALKAVLSK